MPSLLEIPAFAPLQQVCVQFGIHLELFGGCVARLLQSGNFGSRGYGDSVDLFALCPPFTDIDMNHSGEAMMTSEVKRAILGLVPNSECFRWDLRSRSEFETYRRANENNNRIPTRRMTLSSDPRVGLEDSLGGESDIRQRQYRYERNPLYTASPLYREGRDLEFLSGLVYLKSLVDSPLTDDEITDQTALSVVESVMASAQSSQILNALAESSYLRSRIRYLLAAIATGHSTRVEQVLEKAAVRPLLEYFRSSSTPLGGDFERRVTGPIDPGSAEISSVLIRDDSHRIPWLTSGWVAGNDAQNEMQSLLMGDEIMLGEGERIVAASPEIDVTVGRFPSAPSAEAVDEQEFIHINLNLDDDGAKGLSHRGVAGMELINCKEEDIAVFMAIHYGSGKWTVHPVPGYVRWQERPTRALVSLNALGLLSRLAADREPKVRFFLSAWACDVRN